MLWRFFLKLVEEDVLHTKNENKKLFDPNCEKIKNPFERLSQVRNESSDVWFLGWLWSLLTDWDNKGLFLAERVRTSGCLSMSNAIISDVLWVKLLDL